MLRPTASFALTSTVVACRRSLPGGHAGRGRLWSLCAQRINSCGMTALVHAASSGVLLPLPHLQVRCDQCETSAAFKALKSVTQTRQPGLFGTFSDTPNSAPARCRGRHVAYGLFVQPTADLQDQWVLNGAPQR